jgi:phosphatidylinositol alpha-1,6-mannosyltransferase
MRRHLLVTNDFPPKVGGIQAYLWELWRRLDPSTFSVLTASSHPEADDFDRAQAARGVVVRRVEASTLFLPTPTVLGRIRDEVQSSGAGLVVLDPALPLGLAGPRLEVPYAVVVHGAETAVPARLPLARHGLARVLDRAALVIAAGRYPADVVRSALGTRSDRTVSIPPGVDAKRFFPLEPGARRAARARFGLPADGALVLSVSRLVPRKGMDVLIEAVARLRPSFPDLTLAIAGRGRQATHLARLAQAAGCWVHLLGGVADADLPVLHGAADIFAMACRNRWGGLEQEGFGIVFLEAAAAGVPQVAGSSGGSDEAVEHGSTGFVVERPQDPAAVAAALRRLLADPDRRQRMGAAARSRAESSFNYDQLAPRLARALAEVGG